jgi:hypothetical protein
MQDAIDQGGGQTRILHDGGPFGQALVGGDSVESRCQAFVLNVS